MSDFVTAVSPSGDLVLSPTYVEAVRSTDSLFARTLDHSRKQVVQLIRKAPGYAEHIVAQMQRGDVYRARLPKDILHKIQQGIYEPVFHKETGLWNGVVRNAEGKKLFVKQAGFEPVSFDANAVSGLSQIALQAAIAEQTELMREVDRKVDDLLLGQHINRVGLVQSGIDQYETARFLSDPTLRARRLESANQSLMEGRRQLMGDLEVRLGRAVRQPHFFDEVQAYLFGIDRPRAEFHRQFQADRESIVQSVKYINLATAYILRIHAILGEPEAGEQAVQQYLSFCRLVAQVGAPESPYPHELIEGTREFKQLGQGVRSVLQIDRDLVVDVTFEELQYARV